MLISPVQNFASKGWFGWKQRRPRISQLFGKNPDMYKQFGMKGHNGIDIALKVGTPVFAPCDGVVQIRDDAGGYGKHVKIRSPHGAKEVVIGHLSTFSVSNNQKVFVGEQIGLSGNTGYSTGAHLHIGLRYLKPKRGNIWGWEVRNYNNGYYGYIDQEQYIICWKGGLTFTNV